MTELSTRPLCPAFGVEVEGMDLSTADLPALYPALRALFEEHSALLFRAQTLSDEKHTEFARLFGPLEDRDIETRKPGESPRISEVTNILQDGAVSGEMDLHTLNLKANFLWHTDSTFLPVPALTNTLVARVVTSTGGATELASTRAAWAAMPESLKDRIRDRGIWHHFSQSRARISPELAALPQFHRWPAQHWKAVWKNPRNGREALYIASHAQLVDGLDETESRALLEDLTAFCTRPEFVYAHHWSVGDVLIWDQRAVLHRGTPWPWSEPRKLSSICTSALDSDGVADMRLAG